MRRNVYQFYLKMTPQIDVSNLAVLRETCLPNVNIISAYVRLWSTHTFYTKLQKLYYKLIAIVSVNYTE